ncbi:MAG TPA: ATP-binding cassette domain-containing protein, partial [Ghiorsea sp.]|nr:ATP-binding cassette domain-containing protein [Ghiorsea sp.]
MTAALELKSISKTYQRKKGKVDALRDVSLKINQGEVFGFVGPNGAGKSTTIKVILDIIRDYKGEA